MHDNFELIESDCDPIVAQCTPSGSGPLAMIRIAGIGAIDLVSQVAQLTDNKILSTVKSHTIHVGGVIGKQGEMLDQVMFLVMRSPRSFTSQDTVEITCHNNPFIIHNIMSRLLECGARPAQKGEFTRRAVIYKKIDYTQAEAIHEIIQANNPEALTRSLAQLKGSLSHFVTLIENDLLQALAYCEASFEFLDDESIEFGHIIKEILTSVFEQIVLITDQYQQNSRIRTGIRIALIGCVNVGKSSLFNALIGQERAIVSSIAGTTRDTIETGVYINGSYWTFIDTAGLRQTGDTIEQLGIERSHKEAQIADLIILAYDGSYDLSPQEKNEYIHIASAYEDKIILVQTKADKEAFFPVASFASSLSRTFVSLFLEDSIVHLKQVINERISHLYQTDTMPFLLNKRHVELLLSLKKRLALVISMLRPPIAYELVSLHLQDSLSMLSEVTGKTIGEKVMDKIFHDFCIGK